MTELPGQYTALLELLRARGPEKRGWLGDAGFFVPQAGGAPWDEELSARRWRGMHPDLVPFAEDGFGNLFCFYRSERAGCRGNQAVVYWMYETYRAVPISSSFEGFLGWVQLTACLDARRGDPVVDRAHVQRELMPLMEQLGCTIAIDDVLDEPDPSPIALHRAHLRVDANAPAPRVVLAAHLGERGAELPALDLCAEASFTFPEFTAARLTAARIHARSGESDQLAEALFQVLQKPLAYGGDSRMIGFRGVPELDVSWVAERIATIASVPDHIVASPLWTLVNRADPRAPQSWLQAALEFIQEEALEEAVVMASNALFVGFASELGPEIHGLLSELYAELDWEWHRACSARFAVPPK